MEQPFEAPVPTEQEAGSEGLALSKEEMLDLIVDMCLMTDRLCGFSRKSAEVVLSERKKPTNLGKLLFFLKYFREFVGVAEEMIWAPKKEIVRERHFVPLSGLSRVDGATATEMIKQGYPERLPQRILCGIKSTSVDTYEMRFLLWFVSRLIEYANFALPKLLELGQDDEDEAKWSAYVRNEVLGSRQRLLFLLRRLEDMGLSPLSYPQNPPLSFLLHPTYSKLWRLYRQFEGLILPKDLQSQILKVSEWWRLYELWCFLSVVFALNEYWLEDTPKQLDDWLWSEKVFPRPHERNGPHERNECFEVPMKGFWIYYQEYFDYYEKKRGLGSLSTAVIPDICLISDDEESVLIFDAKFKHFKDLIGSQDGASSFQDIHKYRDAIVRNGKHCVFGAFLLAPHAGKQGGFKPFDWEWKTRHRFGAVEMRPRKKGESRAEIAQIFESWIQRR
jgi:predicted component of viral defense system (DUF524 family)